MKVNPLINELATKLFEPEVRRLLAMITTLNADNKKLKDLKVDGFLYGGQFYMPSGVSTVVLAAGQAKATLHFSLNSAMERWLKDRKTIQDDRDLIKQMLFLILKPCESEQDIRDALPECLVSLDPTLSQYERSNDHAYTISHDVRAMRQFEKFLPKMMLYSATRLLY